MDINSIRLDAPAVSSPETVLTPREAAERRELVKAVRAINENRLLGEDREVTFGLDRESRRTVLRIINKETQEVIRQIPSEEALHLAESIR